MMINDRYFDKLCQRDVALSIHSSYDIGGIACFFAAPELIEELIDLIKYCKEHGLEFFIFGHGANILFPDKPKNNKVFISLKRLTYFKIHESKVFFSAGIPLSVLALIGAVTGDAKFDFTFLLPGSLGAGIYINAKCYENQISGIVQTVYYIDLAENDFAIKSVNVDDCEFGYKRSVFQGKPWVIVGAEIHIENLHEYVIEYMDGLLERMRDDRTNLSSLSSFYTFFTTEANNLPTVPPKFEEILHYRNDKRHFEYPSCGSVFKNNYSFGAPMGTVVDQLNLRGKQCGGAMVSPYHGNIIINHNHAKSRDIVSLIDLIKEEVFQAHGFLPEPEVVIIEE